VASSTDRIFRRIPEIAGAAREFTAAIAREDLSKQRQPRTRSQVNWRFSDTQDCEVTYNDANGTSYTGEWASTAVVPVFGPKIITVTTFSITLTISVAGKCGESLGDTIGNILQAVL
jgi:hypothetical protein